MALVLALLWALFGPVNDRVTGAPIAQVRVTVRADGTVSVQARGYLTVTRHDPATAGAVSLWPRQLDPVFEAELLAARALEPRGLRAEGSADLLPQARAILALGERGQAPPVVYLVTPPATVRVWRRALDGSTASCSGRVDRLPLEDYVKGVLPHEWIPSWRAESLNAGATAARTYAWYWVASGGKYSCADVDDTTASQVYRDSRTAATDAAVDATRGQGIFRNQAVVFAEYSAENGDPTLDGVREPYCAGLARQGHGHGMCQWGTQRWALRENRDYRWMVSHYYPGASVQGGGPDYAASFVDRSAPMAMTAGEPAVVYLEYRNDGTETWDTVTTRVGTTLPRDRASPFYDPGNWLSPSRPTAADHSTYSTGVVGRFSFTLRAPAVAADTRYEEHFGLVQENVTWFGPPDDAVSLSLLVHPKSGGGGAGGGSGGAGGEMSPPMTTPGDMSSGCAVGGTRSSPVACAIMPLACAFSLWRRRCRSRSRSS